MEDDLRGYKSLIIIKQIDMDFMVEFMTWVTDWASENGYDGKVRNTPEGYYEIMGKKLN